MGLHLVGGTPSSQAIWSPSQIADIQLRQNFIEQSTERRPTSLPARNIHGTHLLFHSCHSQSSFDGGRVMNRHTLPAIAANPTFTAWD
jgi:hypothetical protein